LFRKAIRPLADLVQQQLQEIVGSMLKGNFVLRIKFNAGRQFSSSKSTTFCSSKTLAVIVRRHLAYNE
jgi:hypothetical protein